MLIGGLDIGTTGCKLTVYTDKGEFAGNAYREYNVSRVGGEHEIDCSVIFDAVCEVFRESAKNFPDLAAVGITSFGQTFVMLDENDRVLFPSMLYTDPRGGEELEALCRKLGEKTIISICGAKPHAMYSLPKLMWLKAHHPDTFEKGRRVLLMEDYIVYMLTGTAQIDYSLAARTMALDIRKKCWSKTILDAAGIDEALFGKLVFPGTSAGGIKESLARDFGFSGKVEIVNGCHDQVAAAIGSGVFKPGLAVDGTGTVECVTPMFDHAPEEEALYEAGYSVVPYVFPDTYVCYAICFTGGATLKWYRDNFAADLDRKAKAEGKNVYALLDGSVPQDPTGILVMPHFAGAGNPYMDNGSRAVIAGLTLEHTSSDLYKALMEGVTYDIKNNMCALADCGISIEKLFVTGGGASSDVWLQIKADILDRPLTSLDAKEVGTCGTCMLVGTAIGLYRDLADAAKMFIHEKKTFYPDAERAKTYAAFFEKYRGLYAAVRPIAGK